MDLQAPGHLTDGNTPRDSALDTIVHEPVVGNAQGSWGQRQGEAERIARFA